MRFLNKVLKKPYFSNHVMANESIYLELHHKAKQNENKIAKQIEEKYNYNIDYKFFENLALHTQVVLKKSKLNYQHGRILYTLLMHHFKKNKIKNVNILETGTARGFSSICMSKAINDLKINGKIFTIDIIPHDVKIYWNCIDDNEEKKTRNELLLKWNNETKNIIFINETTKNFIKKFYLPRINFAFLDAEHKFNDVLREFRYVEMRQEKNDLIFFDDVTPDLFPGVVKAIKFIENEKNYHVEYYLSSNQRGYALAKKL